MAWDSASDGFVLNLKWLNLHTNSTSNDANMLYGGDGITYNITGNISISGNVVILSNNNFNATQPNTNLSVTGTTGPGVKGWTIGGNITIKGSPSQGYILFTGQRTLHFNSLGPHNIQYANFQGRNLSTTSGLLIQPTSGFPIYTIDNITVNGTDKYGNSGLALVGVTSNQFEVLISNSSFTSHDNTSANPNINSNQAVSVDYANLTCIRCNFSTTGVEQGAGWILSLNATDENMVQTNNNYFWGIAHSSSFNATIGARIANWSSSTNLTIRSWDGVGSSFTNSTLIVQENFTVANLTLTNMTFLNISAGNSTIVTNNMLINGTVLVHNNGNLTVMKATTLQSSGFLNSRAGANPINLGSLAINNGGRYNATAGTTTLTSENSDGLAIDNDGTWTHNSGRVNITTSANTTIDIAGTSGSLYDLEISLLNGTNATLLSDVSIAGGLNITGILNTNLTFGYNLTSAGDAYIKSGGRLDAINSTNITFNSLTIEPGGTYNATLYNTSLRGEPAEGRIFNCDGELIANNGIINLASTDAATNVDGLCDSGNIFDLLVTGSAINSDDSFTIDHDLNITFDDFDINGWTLLILGSVNIENSGLLELNANPLNVLGNVLVRDTQSRIWPSTTGRLNVTGTYNVSGSGGLRNANNVGAIYIGRTGSISAGGGDLNITSGNFTNDGSFNHNSSSVIFGGGTNNNQTITGNNETIFFNLNITNRAVNVTLEQNTTIKGVLDIANGSGYIFDATDKTLIVTFGNASGGNTKIINSGTLGFAGNRINFIKIFGASAGHPVKTNGTDWDWDSGGLDSVINLGNLDFQAAATTGGGGVRLNVSAGNVSFTSLVLNTQDQLNISNASNVTLTNSGAITLNGKINLVNGMLFNATINSTIVTLNASNVYLSNVVTTPIDARDIDLSQLANIGKYVNITNLTSTPIMDLNFTYSDNDVPNLAVNEVNLDIYKFNDSDSKWYGTKTGTINTTTNIVSVENYTFIGSVFAAMIRDFVAPAVTSGGTASTSAGETIDIPSITDQKTSTLVDVTQGTETVITNDEAAIPITEISFKSDTDVQGVIITIETFNDVKPDFLGDIANVYDYMKVSIEDIENKLFGLEELAKIKFKVTKEWLELNGLDKKKIKLFIWEDEAWRELDTILLAEEESTIEYQALSDDIDAYFAISLASAEEEASPEDIFNGKLISPSTIDSKGATKIAIVGSIIAIVSYIAYTMYQGNNILRIRPKRKVEARTRKTRAKRSRKA